MKLRIYINNGEKEIILKKITKVIIGNITYNKENFGISGAEIDSTYRLIKKNINDIRYIKTNNSEYYLNKGLLHCVDGVAWVDYKRGYYAYYIDGHMYSFGNRLEEIIPTTKWVRVSRLYKMKSLNII